MEFFARLPKGKTEMVFGNQRLLTGFLESLSRDDSDVSLVVKIEKKKKIRSVWQNRYYRALINNHILPAFIDAGHAPDEVDADVIHDFFKTKFNAKELVNTKTGEIEKLPLSTTGMSTLEFQEYLEHIKRFCAEWFGLDLPEPDTQFEIDAK